MQVELQEISALMGKGTDEDEMVGSPRIKFYHISK